MALGTDECLQRCGIQRSEQPTQQRQPRVSANALPYGFYGPIPPRDASPTSDPQVSSTPVATSSPVSKRTYQARAFEDIDVGSSVSGNVNNDVARPKSDSKVNGVVIALIVVCAVLVAGYIVLAGAYFLRLRNTRLSRTRGNKYLRNDAGPYYPPGLWQVPTYPAEKPPPFVAYPARAVSRDVSPQDPPPFDHSLKRWEDSYIVAA